MQFLVAFSPYKCINYGPAKQRYAQPMQCRSRSQLIWICTVHHLVCTEGGQKYSSQWWTIGPSKVKLGNQLFISDASYEMMSSGSVHNMGYPCIHFCLFVLRFYSPVNPMGSCPAWSVYLTTRLLGRLRPLKRLTSIVHILSPETDNCPSWISRRERMTVENISWSISTKECCRPWSFLAFPTSAFVYIRNQLMFIKMGRKGKELTPEVIQVAMDLYQQGKTSQILRKYWIYPGLPSVTSWRNFKSEEW